MYSITVEALAFSIDYLQFKINSVIPDSRQNSVSGEIKFELKNTKIIPIRSKAYEALFSNQSCNSVFTSIVLPSEQCVPVFKLTTNKHILCCCEQNRSDILGGSFIYFHREIDNACISIIP